METLARALGVVAAQAARCVEAALCVVGWFLVSFFASILAGGVLAGWRPTLYPLVGLGAGLGLLAAVVKVRGLSHLVSQYGLGIGISSAALFLFVAVVPTFQNDPFATECLLTSALLGLLLAGATAHRNPDRVVQLLRRLRAFSNGVRRDGRPWSFLECLYLPLAPVGAVVLSLFGVHDPRSMALGYAALAARERAEVMAASAGHPVPITYEPPPLWLASESLWIVLAILAFSTLYVTLRRLGSGRAARGLLLWLLACGEAFTAIGALAATYRIVDTAD